LTINYLDAGSNEILSSETIAMDAVPVLRNGRVYLPARWVAEARGFITEWDSVNQKVLIYAPTDIKESPTGGVSVDARQVKIATNWLNLDMQIPVISGMTNKALQEKINKEIMDKAMHT
ncbi:hypothetical protein IT084_17750, partial [Desulfallas sp. Bu1-1]|uniref:stalk domain-containing protein n=1 Tax=Desulfallas sp. Bu1-1 TaxID=2787620 RepID=UPI001ECCD123